jgi:hypothetical protein
MASSLWERGRKLGDSVTMGEGGAPRTKPESTYGSSDFGLSGRLPARPDDPAVFGLVFVLDLRVRLTPLETLEVLATERREGGRCVPRPTRASAIV